MAVKKSEVDAYIKEAQFDEIQRIAGVVNKMVDERKTEQANKFSGQFTEQMRALGFSVDLSKAIRGPGSKRASVPRYRDPKNPANTWSGQGRKPAWLTAAIAGDKKIEDFRIVSDDGENGATGKKAA